jgi:hypothetical protein
MTEATTAPSLTPRHLVLTCHPARSRFLVRPQLLTRM